MNIRLAALAGAVIAATLWSPARAADSLQIASSSIGSSDTPVIIAYQLGYFRDAGLDVTLFDAGGGNNAVSSVVGGSAQIAVVSIFNGSKPVEKGQKLKVIGVDTVGFSQILFARTAVLKGSGIDRNSPTLAKAKFLQGKKIAVNDIGGGSGNFVHQLLEAAGLTDRDATIININAPTARLAALKAGRIDAIVGTPPEPETAVVDGYGTMLLNPLTDMPETGPIASTVDVVRADYLAQNRAVLLRYETAVQRGRKLITTDSAAAAKAYYAYIANDARGALMKPAIQDMTWNDLKSSFATTPVLDRAQYANSQKFFKIAPGVTFETYVDNSLAEQVSK
jgi:putative hydroxymethylpyrimidine transport system substrate-binding protein